MDIAGALRRATTGPAMRALTRDLAAALRDLPHPPDTVGELCRALCAAMGALRGGRPVELRFERFPDELDVTGLWVEFQEFDLVIVEERAEQVQQLVILGHELWHLHAGHRHHHAAAADALAGRPGWRDVVLAVAARNGSRKAEEAAADAFGYRLAAAVRGYVRRPDDDRDMRRPHDGRPDPADRVQRALGYRGRSAGTLGEHGRSGGTPGDHGRSGGTPGEHGRSAGTPGDHGQSGGTPEDHRQSGDTPEDHGQSRGTPGERGRSEGTPEDHRRSGGALR